MVDSERACRRLTRSGTADERKCFGGPGVGTIPMGSLFGLLRQTDCGRFRHGNRSRGAPDCDQAAPPSRDKQSAIVSDAAAARAAAVRTWFQAVQLVT
jgi:hypothetical protein